MDWRHINCSGLTPNREDRLRPIAARSVTLPSGPLTSSAVASRVLVP